MTTIYDLLESFIQLDTDKIIESSIEETTEMLADLNALQLGQGQKSDGSYLPDYSPQSVEEFGKPDGPIRLYDTGAYYQGITVKVEGDKVVFNNTDSKAAELDKRYATKRSNILGLNDGFQNEYINEGLLPNISKKLEQATGLKMK